MQNLTITCIRNYESIREIIRRQFFFHKRYMKVYNEHFSKKRYQKKNFKKFENKVFRKQLFRICRTIFKFRSQVLVENIYFLKKSKTCKVVFRKSSDKTKSICVSFNCY